LIRAAASSLPLGCFRHNMDAVRFNEIYDEIVIAPLVRSGFVRRLADAYLEADGAILALLRFQGKFDALRRATNIIVCVRHKFLRGLLDLTVPGAFEACINDYPIKERPSTLSFDADTWRYRPINLGVRAIVYDTVEYGEIGDVDQARQVLEPVVSNVMVGGRALLNRLSPAEGLRQLREWGEGAWCEKVWIEDYERFLGHSAGSTSGPT